MILSIQGYRASSGGPGCSRRWQLRWVVEPVSRQPAMRISELDVSVTHDPAALFAKLAVIDCDDFLVEENRLDLS